MTEVRIAGAQITGRGDYVSEEGGEALTDLKPLVKAATGQSIRRIGRFISLALIGAAGALAGARAPADTAVYFTTGSGDFEVTVEVMEHLFRDGFPPKPLSFINTVSNAACFYVAKAFGLAGRSICVSARPFGFETALQLALLDLKTGAVTSALVGSADIVLAPIEVHRQRLGQPPGAPIGEGAHWLWLRAGPGEGPAVSGAAIFPDVAALTEWVKALALNPSTTAFAAGDGLDAGSASGLMADLGLGQSFDYRAGLPYYDSRSAAAASAFIGQAAPGQSLLHVSTDGDGRYAAFCLQL